MTLMPSAAQSLAAGPLPDQTMHSQSPSDALSVRHEIVCACGLLGAYHPAYASPHSELLMDMSESHDKVPGQEASGYPLPQERGSQAFTINDSDSLSP